MEMGWTVDNLKPCPFCGGAAKLIDQEPYGNPFVMCDNDECEVHCHVDGKTQDEAAALWNRRAPQSPEVERTIPAEDCIFGECPGCGAEFAVLKPQRGE